MLGSDEGIKLGSTDGKLFGTILLNVYIITFRIDIGTDLGSLYGSFDGSNYGNLWGVLIEDSLGYIDGKVFGSDEGIKLISTDGNF